MTRDQIALALQQQQRRGGPLGSPFAPAPVPQRQQPLVAGNPTPPIAAPTPQYGFQTGYNAAIGPQTAANQGSDTWARKLKEMLFGASGTQGGAAP